MKRRATREVMVGNVGIGAHHPVRIQSMTTSDTRDVAATVEQIERLLEAGCEIIRMTVQGKKEALACKEIKEALLAKGINVPLVADIHFYPPAAMTCVEYVDKIRINPGNFVDKRASFQQLEYDDESYQKELDRIEEKFTPLVLKCKELNKAMRIGSNHGSLSDRILNRYGDTAEGMVESALEYARVCRKNDFHNFVFSMKASNTLVMLEAYRLLVKKMDELGWDYPLHLGVTEAGEGEDGRVKSAIGIGTLLLEGLGDTLRVSLTEDPWEEVDPCKRLVQLSEQYSEYASTPVENCPSFELKNLSYLHREASVFLCPTSKERASASFLSDISCQNGKKAIDAPEGLCLYDACLGEKEDKLAFLKTLGLKIFEPQEWMSLDEVKLSQQVSRFTLGNASPVHLCVDLCQSDLVEQIQSDENLDLIFFLPEKWNLQKAKENIIALRKRGILSPILFAPRYEGSKEEIIIRASSEAGALLTGSFVQGLAMKTAHGMEFSKSLSFAILQGCRKRTVKTEFISCPSCGRTLFNLQETSKRIREKTSHLVGVKIAIMGCIVNGPGEMADADFGYVGSRAGKVDLYVGKECVEKNIDFSIADERLIQLIKRHGMWVDPEVQVNPTLTCI